NPRVMCPRCAAAALAKNASGQPKHPRSGRFIKHGAEAGYHAGDPGHPRSKFMGGQDEGEAILAQMGGDTDDLDDTDDDDLEDNDDLDDDEGDEEMANNMRRLVLNAPVNQSALDMAPPTLADLLALNEFGNETSDDDRQRSSYDTGSGRLQRGQARAVP